MLKPTCFPYITALLVSWLQASHESPCRKPLSSLPLPVPEAAGITHLGLPDRYLSLASPILLDRVSQTGRNRLCLRMFWQAQNPHGERARLNVWLEGGRGEGLKGEGGTESPAL